MPASEPELQHSLPVDPESNEPLLQKSSPGSDRIPAINDRQQRPVKVFSALIASCLFLVSLIALIIHGQPPHKSGGDSSRAPDQNLWPVSRGKEEGVSEKAFGLQDGDNGSYPWTDEELAWQRTAYHFQPPNNWMNDPNAPLYYNGWYHLFYQYNPVAAVWGNISWGHAVSNDLIHWQYLPMAMVPDQPFDINGVWTGSATILPDGNITVLYTGDSINQVQVQNLAFPANLSDPLLLEWIKYQGNPVIKPPVGIGVKDFRDPTTAWLGSDGKWRIIIGSKINSTGTGIALVYTTRDFVTFEAVENLLHGVPGTGMWECVDFYPVNVTGSHNGVDNSVSSGDDIKHVLKASLDDNKHDYYAIGTYDSANDSWTPDNAALDVGIGMRVDYGKYYASKTFFDQYKDRRILWGWVAETDTEVDDVEKGWASVQTVPRVVTFDNKTGTNLLQWPVEEVESLRLNSTEVDDVFLGPGSTLNLNITSANQLDVSAVFVVDADALNSTVAPDVFNNCTGTHVRGALGPFGVLVLADDELTERTPVYFYVAKGTDGVVKHWFCTDKSRSTEANGVDKQVYGGPVPVLDDENFSMRILVDHSIVEAFGQGGRTCITSRIYPTQAIYQNATIFLFNNATELNVTASIKVWSLANADLHPYPLDQL